MSIPTIPSIPGDVVSSVASISTSNGVGFNVPTGVVGYDSALGTTNRQLIEAYLATRYGL